MQWLIAAFGIPVGIIAARLDVALLSFYGRVRFGKVAIKGIWAEYVLASRGRQYCLGSIEYDWLHKRYNYSGTNYRNSGAPYCHWQTVSSYLDRDNKKFHYVFATSEVSRMYLSSYGYGVINLQRVNGRLVPADGYYVYVGSGNEAVSVSHTMKRVDSLPPRTANVSEILDKLFPEERSKKI